MEKRIVSSWIDNEVMRIQENEYHASESKRLQLEKSQAAWKEIVLSLKQSIDQINHTKTLNEKLGCKLQIKLNDNKGLEIIKDSYPLVSISILNYGDYFLIRRFIISLENDLNQHEQCEKLKVIAQDNNRFRFQINNESFLTSDDIACYLLSPLWQKCAKKTAPQKSKEQGTLFP